MFVALVTQIAALNRYLDNELTARIYPRSVVKTLQSLMAV
ncbi:hypothetical protein LDG_6159 [Legionella drancourtii LLAP12]|uniref:Uncharacterized protein n=1 Tax=Legionella drancourtii LLAP12 TaxID=658187 RepID=G9EL99_9GAMM|nr:hypothetical protein LDG_6159 [Legionella drancourtii LLAP12]